jgi:transcriptional regulator with XRE-family HTH domain
MSAWNIGVVDAYWVQPRTAQDELRQEWLPAAANTAPETPSQPDAAGPVVSDCSPSIGSTIRARRRELGLTQEELAARVRVLGEELRQSDVSRTESGKVALPRYPRLSCIAAALELPLGDLLARAGWAGADGAFAWEDAANVERPVDAAEPAETFAPPVHRDSRPALPAGFSNGVIARAEASVARTEVVCRQQRMVDGR